MNIGSALVYLRRLVPTTAKYVLMAKACKSKRAHFVSIGHPEWIFDDQQRMSKKAVGACLQQVAQMAGIPEWKKRRITRSASVVSPSW
jgi:hypothetical protein